MSRRSTRAGLTSSKIYSQRGLVIGTGAPRTRIALHLGEHEDLLNSADTLWVAGLPSADAAMAAADELIAAAAIAVTSASVLTSGEQDQRDALSDEEHAFLVGVLVDGDGDPAATLACRNVADLLLQRISLLARSELLPGVDELGAHEDLSSVGRPGVVAGASAGSRAGVPAADDPTVEAPADAPPVPLRGGASADQGSPVESKINGRMTGIESR